MDKRSFFVLILFTLSLWGAYSIYAPFILSMVVAVLLAMATTNLTQYLARTLRSRKLATIVMVIFLILIILAPLIYIATNGVEYISHLDKDTISRVFLKIKSLTNHIPYINHWVDEYLQVDKISPYLKEITLYVTKMGSKGIGFLKNITLVITFYAVVVYYQERFLILLEALIPAPPKESHEMVDEVASTMEVVIYSIIMTALFEGLLFGIFISYFGFDGLLFGAIYGFASLVPVVGGALVWVPSALYAWTKFGGNTAFLIAGYSIIVISVIADTFVKPIFIKMIKEQLLHVKIRVNELVIFFSIIAGMSSYGFWGMILGPAITAFLFASTRIYLSYSNGIDL